MPTASHTPGEQRDVQSFSVHKSPHYFVTFPKMRLLSTFHAVVLATAIAAPFVGAVDVGSCEEFAAVDRKTETEMTITNADFACDEYTRVSIRSDMVLKSSVGPVTFSNFSLKIYESLIVEPDVIFTGIVDVVSVVVVVTCS